LDTYKIPFEKIEWKSTISGVRHKVYSDGSRVLRLVEYSDEMEPHWCAKAHIGLILEGEFEIEFHGGKSIFKTGDGVFIPSGEEHKHRARVLTGVVKAIFVEESK
jgi:ethanolamine utilization protein EutQ (cupin superfamily)